MTEITTYEGWAIVEQMGFKRTVGKIAEIEMYGTKLLRIDRPYFKLENDREIDGWVTAFAGGQSIYNITPIADDVGVALARKQGDPRPVRPIEYRLECIPEPPVTPAAQEWRDGDPDEAEVDNEEILF